MVLPRRLLGLVTAVAVAVTAAACSAGTSGKEGGPATATRDGAVAGTLRQLGVDVDFYFSPGLNVASTAKALTDYVRQLHGNAMSVSFPFFMDGPDSQVQATSRTPTPAELATVAGFAQRAGLYFSLRPLLDESSLDFHGGRTHWRPAHPARWFASYARFLRPYVQMAQRQHIPEFVIGTEFDAFNASPRWASLARYLRRYYEGTLAYSNNWDVYIRAARAGGILQLLDAYQPMPLPDDATQAKVTASWRAFLRSEPPGVILSEVGIAAKAHAYAKPYDFVPNGTLIPAIQVRWMTAACDAVAAEHDGGIYFWSVNFGQSLTAPPGPDDPASFVAGPGAAAINACFKRLGSSASSG